MADSTGSEPMHYRTIARSITGEVADRGRGFGAHCAGSRRWLRPAPMLQALVDAEVSDVVAVVTR